MSLRVKYIRYQFGKNDAKRDAGLTTPAGVVRFDDLSYGPDAKWNRLDLYRPVGAEGKLPVIVSVHGGGWVYGDKELYQYYCMSLVKHGFAVVNFSYRLAPEHKFPAQIEDTDAVFRWVLEHADAYSLDTGHVFGVGDSAGAHLLALYTCACLDPAFASELSIRPPESFLPAALALNCGLYHVDWADKSSRGLAGELLSGRVTPEALKRISVLEHVREGFPPCLVMTCAGDFLEQAAPPLVERLKSLGVPVDYRYYGDSEHQLGHVFHCNMYLEEAAQCNRDECEYFRSFC